MFIYKKHNRFISYYLKDDHPFKNFSNKTNLTTDSEQDQKALFFSLQTNIYKYIISHPKAEIPHREREKKKKKERKREKERERDQR